MLPVIMDLCNCYLVVAFKKYSVFVNQSLFVQSTLSSGSVHMCVLVWTAGEEINNDKS